MTNLNSDQIELLEMIQVKLRRRDIKVIAEKTRFSREYVSTVLSPTIRRFNEDIVNAAVEIISKREQNTKQLLKKLTA